MSSYLRLRLGVAPALLVLAALGTAQDEPAPAADLQARLFVSRCTGCHSVGRGALTGPDLTTAITWREADIEKAIGRMQEKAGALTPDDTGALVALLKDAGVKDRIAAEEARIVQMFAAKLQPASAEEGAALFRGNSLFSKGGMACIACHRIGNVDGGTLGPDLSGIFGRMGQSGLVSALQKAPFKVMSPVYQGKPLSPQEVLHLARWFESVDAVVPPPRKDPIGPAAASVAVLCLGALVVGTAKTKRASARDMLTRRNRS